MNDWTDTLDGLDPEELRSLAKAATLKAEWLEIVSKAQDDLDRAKAGLAAAIRFEA